MGRAMSSLGIMTLTRTPCELDKMSLFQDLKLKRRKVDSRCSSDGESVADTSTSSPDLVSPSSPKMSDVVGPTPPSPDSTPPSSLTRQQQQQHHHHHHHHQHQQHHQQHHHHHQQQDNSMMTSATTAVAITTSTTTTTSDLASSRLQESGVFDGGGGGGSTTSVIRLLPVSRAQSPPVRPAPATSPAQPPRPHSSPGRPANSSPIVRQSPLIITPPTNSRINGVKPELIGGNFSNSVLGAPLRQTPTVIMGEAGGVRTMIWSQPTTPLPQTTTIIEPQIYAATTSTWSNSSNSNMSTGTNPEESAAQMLLNLGQDNRSSSGRQMGTATSAATGRTAMHHHQHVSSIRSPTSTSSSSSSSAAVAAAAAAVAAAVANTTFTNVPLNMERLWAGDLTQLPANQALNLTSSSNSPNHGGANVMYSTTSKQQQQQQDSSGVSKLLPGIMNDSGGVGGGAGSVVHDATDDDDQPMICMICEDKATGLHYGIITCEGCKGFFKRTVQNRRVYTCVADGNCEITKAQRNRCQYCRFKKCIEQGMVLQAVREDRMPGGRNSGAVYNLYKVKYKKHKKAANKQTQQQHLQQQQQQQQQQLQQKSLGEKAAMLATSVKLEQAANIPSHLVNGTILKTALTNPSEVVHLRQRLDTAVSSSRDRHYSTDYTLSMIQTLIDCDEFQDIATLQNLDDLLDHKSDLSEKLCQIGDSIVYKLVQWTKRLPFYLELPVEVHTRLLTHKWHELLVLTTSAYQAIHGQQHHNQHQHHNHHHHSKQQSVDQQQVTTEPDFTQEVTTNLCTLQNCLTSMMGRQITMDQLRQDVGLMVEKITHVTLMFRRIKLSMEEYVCLKVITMLNQARPGGGAGATELENIQERYMACLRVYTQHICPQQPSRFQELLVRLPEVQSAAALLLESKMFYVPFLLNSAIQR
ncbi:PREDICTED: hormone receptor 4 [Nicrophorus vespilloides]|uniref:Hormone receptor 4 n=1 Tax=Nicrophorus vespilloides TaxID=110193 RepID=A0ABM1NJN6_NICVS|nr:PREDICTED: hormone receptor 4 [Nicrophorus vespilloides]